MAPSPFSGTGMPHRFDATPPTPGTAATGNVPANVSQEAGRQPQYRRDGPLWHHTPAHRDIVDGHRQCPGGRVPAPGPHRRIREVARPLGQSRPDSSPGGRAGTHALPTELTTHTLPLANSAAGVWASSGATTSCLSG